MSSSRCPACGHVLAAEAPAPSLRCSAEVYALLGKALSRRRQERFLVVALDARNRIIGRHLVAVGSLSTCVVHPREVFAPLIRRRAAAALLVHNHPSGSPSPSPEVEAIVATRHFSAASGAIGPGLQSERNPTIAPLLESAVAAFTTISHTRIRAIVTSRVAEPLI